MTASISRPATDRQYTYLRDLLHTRELEVDVASRLRERLAARNLTKDTASKSIDWVLNQPRRVAQPLTEPTIAAPAYDDGAASPEVFKGLGVLPKADSSLGLFELDGKIYKIRWNKSKTNQYAEALVYDVAHIEAVTANNVKIRPRYRYAPGKIGTLRESHRVTGTRAAELQAAFSACIVCGHALSNPTSVSRGIGPVCWSRLAH